MIRRALEVIMGDQNEKQIKKLRPLIAKINQIEEGYQQSITSDEQIKEKTAEFKQRIANGETLDALLPEAFALVKNACRRLYGREFELKRVFSEELDENGNPAPANKQPWKMIPYDVQLLGGIILHQGKISEMKTGEGKTLVSTLPLYLNALNGEGVFLVTVNEYLAQRDAEWMGVLYNFLGLSVGVILNGQPRPAKKAAYNCDITYGTNNEFGFDYLRDNMATSPDSMVQRKLKYAIVDEVDSILIDEARTPLIISSQGDESTDKYNKHSLHVRHLEEGVDYEIDEKQRAATLTEAGIAKMENLLGLENIYTDAGFEEVHHLEQALKAQSIFKKDVDYVVKDGEIIIVDEFTGRLMPGRRYSDGLHQAIEAKEGVEIRRESKTLATVTFQNYFRLFEKLGGMTGTAKTEEEEFLQIYRLETLVVPTNRDVTRQDRQDLIFKNTRGKYSAVAKRVKEAHQIGQPVLIGTVSIEKSELLSNFLQKEGIPHSILNAKFHEKEAEIIAKAGIKGAVTIATNMAGRGTDIKIDDEVKSLGGLLVIGTERHESRRIDNQLRGRSGRQGDPGESQFFVSMEDDLMRLFGSDKIKNMMEALKVPEDMPLQASMMSKRIESAQKAVEGRNFDIRKHLVEYDDVINKQREIIYSRRRKALLNEDIKNEILILIEKEAERIVKNSHNPENRKFNYDEIMENLSIVSPEAKGQVQKDLLEKEEREEDLIQFVKTYLLEVYANREAQLVNGETLRRLEKAISLSVIDSLWMNHIDFMQQLRESVSLRGYGQRDPLIEYKEQAFEAFRKLLSDIQVNTINTLYRINLSEQLPAHLIRQENPLDENLQTNESQIEQQLQTSPIRVISNGTSNATNPNIPSSSSGWAMPAANSQSSAEPGLRVVQAGIAKTGGSGRLTCANLGRNDVCPECNVKAKKCPKQNRENE
ncbi:MAG: preprotein translocase subunit SecA [Candidatus Altimarinota bacterium]